VFAGLLLPGVGGLRPVCSYQFSSACMLLECSHALYMLKSRMVHPFPCICTAVMSGDSIRRSVQLDVSSRGLISMRDLVLSSFLKCVGGYTGRHPLGARLLLRWSRYGSCMQQMS
jgi:hypothetical protein